jgi:predicted nucleic acid-binding protein
MAVLVDTGVMIAALDADDVDHAGCADLLRSRPGPMRVPMLVVAEATYFVQKRLGVEVEVRFLGDLGVGNFVAEPVEPTDWQRIAELVWQYRDFPLGTVDASVIAAAERLEINEIATLDRRHFGAVRPSHVDAFELLP